MHDLAKICTSARTIVFKLICICYLNPLCFVSGSAVRTCIYCTPFFLRIQFSLIHAFSHLAVVLDSGSFFYGSILKDTRQLLFLKILFQNLHDLSGGGPITEELSLPSVWPKFQHCSND